ncbi:hypothetical protein IVB08_10090 [Bradyrhizobium sp. 173]|uniref:hypothetical protein n=1 Tax=Bradyrhizobium sp. 173 TaxID=2782644 RepID=UPI001FFBB56F|nr:hypothetical protein [Bradyrhizobium sp. 173]MCK1564308.1 hypothetical protein [Bradyrhizobium sp. 173]
MAGKINSYAAFQDFMDACCVKAQADPDLSGHGRWWRVMDHKEFVTTGEVKQRRVVVVGDPDNSVVIQALSGVPPDFADDPSALFGRMPQNAGAFFEPADIDEIADWIKRGCPNGGGSAPSS